MKNTLILLSILLLGISTSAQQSDPNGFKGKWVAQLGVNNNFVLNFIDSSKIYFSPGANDNWKGTYNYRVTKSNTAFIITLQAVDNTHKDSFQIVLTRISNEEYKLNDILHLYDDGRPPESELLENKPYILKKIKDN